MAAESPAVLLEGLWKYFGSFPALRDVSFAVRPGAAMALLGRNGAGKTTLLRILAGLSRPDRGKVTILGGATRSAQVRARIGLLGHGIGIYDELSALENLTFHARLQGLAEPARAAHAWLERTGLHAVRDGLAREFSRGMRQRLAVARAFLHEPSLLLLDEPFTALDDRAIAVLQGLLREALDRGATVVMSTHQLREALELATDVAMVQKGRVVHCGPRTEAMLADPALLYRTYGEPL